MSPGKLHSDLGGPGGSEGNKPWEARLPEGMERAEGWLFAPSFIHGANISWAYYVPDLYSAPEMQCQTEQARSLLSWSSHCPMGPKEVSEDDVMQSGWNILRASDIKAKVVVI